MIRFRDRMARGQSRTGWLDSRHTFSFADYRDPAQMGFRALRVINEDRVIPGAGFPPHRHADMEIITCVLEGALEHKDSLGSGSVIRPGDVQRMSAGTGVLHSEFNASNEDQVHFLQIWLLPERRNLPPGYEQKTFGDTEKRGKLRLVASRDGRDGSVTVHQDVALYAGLFDAGEKAEHALSPGRHAWVHVARGSARVNGVELAAGDAAQLSEEERVVVEGVTGGEVLVFDLA
jgi:redox-sensitive bicupin YhaK (pirin superfamily)